MSRLKLLAGYKKGFRDDQNFQFPVLRERLLLKNGQDTNLDALYRGDTGAPLSVVSPKYVVTPQGSKRLYRNNANERGNQLRDWAYLDRQRWRSFSKGISISGSCIHDRRNQQHRTGW